MTEDDRKVIAASARKIIGDMREAGAGRGLGTLYRNICLEAAAILKLTDPHAANVLPFEDVGERLKK